MRCGNSGVSERRAAAARKQPATAARLLRVQRRRDELQRLHLPEVRGVAEHVQEHEFRDRARAQAAVLGGAASHNAERPRRERRAAARGASVATG